MSVSKSDFLVINQVELDSYQERQLTHDIAYHPDIVSLGTPKRMTHVALASREVSWCALSRF